MSDSEVAVKVDAWMAASDCRIERNDCTRLHRLAEALSAKAVLGMQGESLNPKVDDDDHAIIVPPQTFIVRHDWYAAVGDAAAEVGNEFRLPFPHCAFEFRINGRTFINVAMQPDDEPMSCCGFLEIDRQWVCLGDSARDAEPTQFAWHQVRSICVALDAEVATHEVVHAPAKLNANRERKGQPLIADHRVIDLARRHRVAGVATGEQPKGSKRLHFRRGHWRHYDDHKTWIKWTLVGNPDLGFIDHHYTL